MRFQQSSKAESTTVFTFVFITVKNLSLWTVKTIVYVNGPMTARGPTPHYKFPKCSPLQKILESSKETTILIEQLSPGHDPKDRSHFPQPQSTYQGHTELQEQGDT